MASASTSASASAPMVNTCATDFGIGVTATPGMKPSALTNNSAQTTRMKRVDRSGSVPVTIGYVMTVPSTPLKAAAPTGAIRGRPAKADDGTAAAAQACIG